MQIQPCNCRGRRSVLSRLDAVMSRADSICFSSFFFPSSRSYFHIIPNLWNPLILFVLLIPFPPPQPPQTSPAVCLFWSCQEWWEWLQRGRCHSQTPKWQGGGLLHRLFFLLLSSHLSFWRFQILYPHLTSLFSDMYMQNRHYFHTQTCTSAPHSATVGQSTFSISEHIFSFHCHFWPFCMFD